MTPEEDVTFLISSIHSRVWKYVGERRPDSAKYDTKVFRTNHNSGYLSEETKFIFCPLTYLQNSKYEQFILYRCDYKIYLLRLSHQS